MAARRATTTAAATPTIERLDVSDDGLDVRWDDGLTSEYPWLWLRDHAHDDGDAAPGHPATAAVHGRASPPTCAGSARRSLGDDVSVTWGDDTPPSRLPIEFLARFRQPRPARAAVDVERVLWDADAHRRAVADGAVRRP